MAYRSNRQLKITILAILSFMLFISNVEGIRGKKKTHPGIKHVSDPLREIQTAILIANLDIGKIIHNTRVLTGEEVETPTPIHLDLEEDECGGQAMTECPIDDLGIDQIMNDAGFEIDEQEEEDEETSGLAPKFVPYYHMIHNYYRKSKTWDPIDSFRYFYNARMRVDTSTSPHTHYVELTIPNLDPKEMYDIFNDVDYQKRQHEWNPFLISIDLHEDKEEDVLLYRSRIDMPVFIKDREFIDGKTQFVFKDKYYVIMENREDLPSARKRFPENSDYVRGSTNISAHCFEKRGKDTIYKIVLQSDLRGYVPHYILNKFVPRSAIEYAKSILEFREKKMMKKK